MAPGLTRKRLSFRFKHSLKKTSVLHRGAELKDGSRRVRFPKRSHSRRESRKKDEGREEMKSMGERVVPPEAKETRPPEELKVSKRQSPLEIEDDVMDDEPEEQVEGEQEEQEEQELSPLTHCTPCRLPQFSAWSNSQSTPASSVWSCPATPMYFSDLSDEWEEPVTPNAGVPDSENEMADEDVADEPYYRTPLVLTVKTCENWEEKAKDLIQNKLTQERYLEMFLRSTSNSETFPGILEKLEEGQYKTKASFECAINEIAEITQQNNAEGSRAWWKSEYLKMFFRIHWDADVNYEYTRDEISLMNWKLNKIHRKLQPDEVATWMI